MGELTHSIHCIAGQPRLRGLKNEYIYMHIYIYKENVACQSMGIEKAGDAGQAGRTKIDSASNVGITA